MANSLQKRILKEYPKAVAHLRAQYQRARLGLIFGSGIGNDLNFPSWEDLVQRMACHKDIDAEQMVAKFKIKTSQAHHITESLSSLTQILFNHFREKSIKSRGLIRPLSFVDDQKIMTNWLRILHHELYRDLDKSERRKKIRYHPYLGSFKDIIRKSPITVNYNFDDSVEQMLLTSRNENEKNITRGYEIADRPNAQFQNGSGVIYHPNGYLSSIFEDGASAELVFSDDAFQDQIISAATGKYLHLSNHLFSNTCLLVGLSLDDATLKSMLRQNAVSSSGNIHYIVHFTPKGTKRDKEAEDAIFNSNFESFNLYTLFLDQSGIKALTSLIKMEKGDLKLTFGETPPKFVYYLIGSVGSGKSTAASYLRNLTTYDEWIDEREPELARPESELSKQQIRKLNTWVAEQWRKKNFALSEVFDGIHIVDRAPLDPLTFGKPAERSAKAKRLLTKMISGGATSVTRGHIIYLSSCVEDVRYRTSLKHKYWTNEEYQELIDNIVLVYSKLKKSTVYTGGRGPAAVAKEIARVIFTEEYSPEDIGAELVRISQGGGFDE